MSASCRSCGAPIVWAVTRKGKRMPLDAEPVDGGNVVIVEPARGSVPPVAEVREPALTDPSGLARYTSHFATCPQADSWRSR